MSYIAKATHLRMLWRGLACMILILAAGVTWSAADAARRAPSPAPIEILLVGNSVIYFNDLPAHLEAFSQSGGARPVRVTMLAGPGHRMIGHDQGGAVAGLLASRHFDWLILQEVGGTLICDESVRDFGFDCQSSHEAHQRLADLGRQAGARVMVLGTYSWASDERGRLLAEAESALAKSLSASHVSLAELQACAAMYPYLRWVAPDRGHPGPDMTAMMAIRILAAIGQAPQFSTPLVVEGHGFDLRRSPRAIIPHREHDQLPLLDRVRWSYAPEVLAHLQQCNAEQAARITELCQGQKPCLGRDQVWVPGWFQKLSGL